MTPSSPSLLTSNLVQRVLSALALIPVVLGAVWVGEWAFLCLIMLICGIGMHEWMLLTAPKLPRRARIVSLIGLLLVFVAVVLKGTPQALGLAVLACLMVGTFAHKSESSKGIGSALWPAFGVLYLAFSGMALLYLRQLPENGLAMTVYLLLIVWGTDTGAYFSGRLIGGPKLLPSISPKKTWAGLIGGMVFAGVIGYGVAQGFGDSRLLAAVGVAMVMAVVAQAGDFLESYVKRRAGAKDSGTLIPGHGGVLDRVDGLIAASLFLAVIEIMWG
ncbi:MAG: phosphatidate cytidylyltransferase [Alphaproteobacteria bacterium]|nr:phosphatidate cytidylyltransferase [Alphaproteobacteria bacterium]